MAKKKTSEQLLKEILDEVETRKDPAGLLDSAIFNLRHKNRQAAIYDAQLAHSLVQVQGSRAAGHITTGMEFAVRGEDDAAIQAWDETKRVFFGENFPPTEDIVYA